MAPKLDQLRITVAEAKNLATMDRSGTSDPYVTIKNSFNKQHYKTKVSKKTLTPKWEQTFNFFLYGLAEGTIQLKVMDHDLFTRDELMGEVILNLADYADGNAVEKWFVLANEPQKKKKTPEKGELKLRLHFDVTPNPDDKKVEKAPENHGKEEVTPQKPVEKKEEKKEEKAKPATIEEKYDLGKVIGRGAFSEVKEGIRKQNGKKYAVKCISKKLIDKKELALLEREIDIMKKLQHPNIIQLMEVVDTQDTLFLVLEYASGGELFDAIVTKGFYSEADAAKIVKQILEAIKYVHNHGIAHRDLKPENLLLIKGDDGTSETIKIADFGLSKDFGQEQLMTSCGTPDYVAPEVLLGEPYDMAVDVWSIGVISYVLLCGFPPFYGDSQKELFENIMNGRFDFPDPEWSEVSELAKNFIKRILVVDPEKRATAEQCLEDPWIKEFAAANNKKEFKRLETFSVQKFKEYTKKYKEQNPNAV